MLIPILLFIVGLVLLIKGGDWFVDGATGIAHRFRIPDLVIGATVVSVGTTLPEVMVSATSALSGHGEIAYGNAVGSIICNTALIAAVSIAIHPPVIEKKTFKLPVTFFFIAAAVYLFTAYVLGEFSRPVGLTLLFLFAVYMIWTVIHTKKESQMRGMPEADQAEENKNSGMKDIIFLLLGAVLIAFGANLLVENGTLIATALHVPESVIALTFVALGTSLPELVTAVTALIKGHGSLSLGNIIGANLFNLVLVSGVSVTLSPFTIPQSKLIAGRNASLMVDLPVMLFVMAFLTIPALIRGKIARIQGIVLIMIYAAFCALQFWG